VIAPAPAAVTAPPSAPVAAVSTAPVLIAPAPAAVTAPPSAPAAAVSTAPVSIAPAPAAVTTPPSATAAVAAVSTAPVSIAPPMRSCFRLPRSGGIRELVHTSSFLLSENEEPLLDNLAHASFSQQLVNGFDPAYSSSAQRSDLMNFEDGATHDWNDSDVGLGTVDTIGAMPRCMYQSHANYIANGHRCCRDSFFKAAQEGTAGLPMLFTLVDKDLNKANARMYTNMKASLACPLENLPFLFKVDLYGNFLDSGRDPHSAYKACWGSACLFPNFSPRRDTHTNFDDFVSFVNVHGTEDLYRPVDHADLCDALGSQLEANIYVINLQKKDSPKIYEQPDVENILVLGHNGTGSEWLATAANCECATQLELFVVAAEEAERLGHKPKRVKLESTPVVASSSNSPQHDAADSSSMQSDLLPDLSMLSHTAALKKIKAVCRYTPLEHHGYFSPQYDAYIVALGGPASGITVTSIFTMNSNSHSCRAYIAAVVRNSNQQELVLVKIPAKQCVFGRAVNAYEVGEGIIDPPPIANDFTGEKHMEVILDFAEANFMELSDGVPLIEHFRRFDLARLLSGNSGGTKHTLGLALQNAEVTIDTHFVDYPFDRLQINFLSWLAKAKMADFTGDAFAVRLVSVYYRVRGLYISLDGTTGVIPEPVNTDEIPTEPRFCYIKETRSGGAIHKASYIVIHNENFSH
jgi:hypothetical protein